MISAKIAMLERDIDSKETLWYYLRIAMEIELATIPPYLCALYSIKADSNTQASKLIQSVVMEEMLHLTLVSNILSATGGTPMLNHPEFVPSYPTELPDSDISVDGSSFTVPLQPLTRDAIETFMRIEKPGQCDAPPELVGWQTIGQFYNGLMEGLTKLCDKIGAENVFTGNPIHQIRPEDYYGGAGKVIVITDASATRALSNANEAMQEIMHQGEGLDHQVFDGDTIPGKGTETYPIPAHFFRFREIQQGQYYVFGDKPEHPSGKHFDVDWEAVYPMRVNPKMADYARGSEIREKMLEFNRTYMRLLDALQAAFSGQRETLMEAVTVMYELKYQAIALMKIPSDHGQTTVGPSFEYVPPGA